ncbi:MAG: response regulator [Gemmatimonadota bacterium]
MAAATVLLIDSDADSIAIYSMILQHHGFAVIHAHDPETGLRVALETRPDLVVSELFLPAVRGLSLFNRLRADQRVAETPVIVLDSILSTDSEFTEALGSLNRLKKPCEPSRLLLEVQRLLARPVTLAQ